MLPTPIFEWAFWANLDSHKSAELILLKGHLLLEIAISQTLRRHHSLSDEEISGMSFHRKVLVLEKISEEKCLGLNQALAYARNLNSIRNKLAHEAFFNHEESDISNWAEKVLSDFPSMKFQKFTSRTKLTQAMASLSSAIYTACAA